MTYTERKIKNTLKAIESEISIEKKITHVIKLCDYVENIPKMFFEVLNSCNIFDYYIDEINIQNYLYQIKFIELFEKIICNFEFGGKYIEKNLSNFVEEFFFKISSKFDDIKKYTDERLEICHFLLGKYIYFLSKLLHVSKITIKKSTLTFRRKELLEINDFFEELLSLGHPDKEPILEILEDLSSILTKIGLIIGNVVN